MPYQIDGIIMGNICILWFVKISGYLLLLGILKRAALDIADESVFCTDFFPVFLLFEDNNLILFADF